MDSTSKNRAISEIRKDIILTKLSTGASVTEVARELNLTPNHIHDWLRSYEGLERLESSLRGARLVLERRLPSLIEKALNVLESSLDAPFMSTAKMTAAKTIIQTTARLSSERRCTNCDENRSVN
ncbi:MAG: helix-turn-helix domain containing protein [Methylobacter sp.]|nr:helix-turn-helix domain containing protein [Methylobacter sp.]